MRLFSIRRLSSFVVAFFFVFLNLIIPLPAYANSIAPFPGMTGSVIDDLARIPEIPIKDFPKVTLTEDIQQQLAAIGSPLPSDFKVGDILNPQDLFRVGNFEMLGLPDVSLSGIANLTNVDLSQLGINQVSGFFSSLTPEKLLNVQGLNLGDMKLAEVPLLKELALQSIYEKIKDGKLSELTDLNNLLGADRVSGSLQEITSGIFQGILGRDQVGQIFAGGLPDLSQLPEGIELPLGLPLEVPAELGQLFGNTTVQQISDVLPDFVKTAVTGISPERLGLLSIPESIPGIDKIEIGQIADIENLSLSSFGDLNVANLSLSQMPSPMRLLPGIRTGVADISLGTPGAGDREQQRVRIVSGGITSRNMVQNGARCEGNSCPHFEIATPGDPEFHGTAWMDAKGQRVPDGFGILCKPWSCKGPPGNHPFGSAARVLLTNINQSTGTADVSLSFAFCRRIPFVGRSCTPWVFPTPSGIPIGKIREKTLLAFVPPGKYVAGDVSDGFLPPPDIPEPEQVALAPQSPRKPVSPPARCVDQGTCPLLNPLPDQSAIGIYSRFRRRRPRHNGIDHQSKNAAAAGNANKPTAGAIVVAPDDGIVREVCEMPCGGYGNYVELALPKQGVWTVHAHLYQIKVRPNQKVKRGEVIGIEGGTGRQMLSYGIHEHLEIKTAPGMNRGQVDPERYRWASPNLHNPPKPQDLFGG